MIYENKRLYHQPNHNYNDYYRIKSYPDHTYDTELLVSSQNNSHKKERHTLISSVFFHTPAESQSTPLSTKGLNACPNQQASSPKSGHTHSKRIQRTNKQIAKDQANLCPKKHLSCSKGWRPPIGIRVLFSLTSRTYAHIWRMRNIIMAHLFGDSKKTAWGKKKHTREQAFKCFSQYLNDNHVLGMLNLNGRNIQKWWRTYKRKFVDTTLFLNSTGAGTTDGSYSTIQEEIEDHCPCYKRMMGIFGDKQNLVGQNF
ncbi:hypothetical protein O181_073930 [Austropuccinia psidii MF-1]|uniref:Uncharacterized protein n=1 Tax=Austropuccinia psidii MF-1 TaxID=1389203 RepID=A0A9Q3FBH1_9BASI|nr:hypothetical protein [Austropuccinia psidii MF-1]